MTRLADRLIRPEIRDLPDIAPATGDGYAADAIRLDANENGYAPLLNGDLAATANRYPEPRPTDLTAAMAALYGVPPHALLVTRGGDDAIDALIRSFCRPGEDAIAVVEPTFVAYTHFARLQGARLVSIEAGPDFAFDAERLIAAVRDDGAVKLVFLCSPNNPTGDLLAPETVRTIAERLPETLIVLDEAYIEFSEAESLAAEAVERDNLIVLRTLSKAYGLAGARVGAAIAPPETIALVSRALPLYPLPSLSIAAALATLAPARRPLIEDRIAQIVAAREAMAGQLAQSPTIRSLRSGGGNFLLLEVEDAAALAEKLRARGIRIRYLPHVAPNAVRLTIGAPAENAAALAAFGVGEVPPAARRAEIVRETAETQIGVAVDLDAETPRRIDTGIGFYDHMLDQVAGHGGFALTVSCRGDLEIDAHHSIEDIALALGAALGKALGERRGIGRFGFALPMDEAEAQVLLDLSGRPYSRFEGRFEASHIGDYPTEMTPHIFRSIADSLGCALHVRVEGENDHHKTEACFKAFGRALRTAIRQEGESVPSTKGTL